MPARELSGFAFEGQLIRLKGPQGIFKPKELDDGPISLLTALDSPYHDEPSQGARVIRYDYSPKAHENEGLKRLAQSAAPLIYLIQVKRKPDPEYMVVSPVFVSRWDDQRRVFEIEYHPQLSLAADRIGEDTLLEQRYSLQIVRARLHQAHFRKRVLEAYRNRCAVCELRVRPLLDGAHIVPDSEASGQPVVSNGLSLCALHHRAFDRRILTVDDDYSVNIDRSRILRSDRAAQQNLVDHHGRRLRLPSAPDSLPDPWRLEQHRLGA